MQSVRSQLCQELGKINKDRDWSFIEKQIGMFRCVPALCMASTLQELAAAVRSILKCSWLQVPVWPADRPTRLYLILAVWVQLHRPDPGPGEEHDGEAPRLHDQGWQVSAPRPCTMHCNHRLSTASKPCTSLSCTPQIQS